MNHGGLYFAQMNHGGSQKESRLKDARKSTGVMVRLPDELKSWLKHQAVDNRRSLTSEIQIRLEQSRAQQSQGTSQ